MNNITQWTEESKMKINESKSKMMVFNRTDKYQFSTRIHSNNTLLDTISETKLLGTIVSSDLTWHANTKLLTTKYFQSLIILRNLYKFNLPRDDLEQMYIRSILEYNSPVWFSSITKEEENKLERVQKIACNIKLKEN